MSIKYSVTALKNPQRPQAARRYYAKAQVREVISLWVVACELARQAGLTEGDVYNVLCNLPYVVKKHLENGDMVDLEKMGKFQCQLRSSGADSHEEFTHHNIQEVRYQYRPSKLMRESTNKLEFEEVITRKDMQAAKRLAKSRVIGD